MKNRSWKKLLSLSFVLALIHSPFVFSTSILMASEKKFTNIQNVTHTVSSYAMSVYETIGLQDAGLSFEVFNYAVKGRDYLVSQGRILKDQVLTVVDFTKPSSEKRMYVIDLNKEKILFHTYVAHGQNSGAEFAQNFSNKPESFQSSLGFYETLGTYNGKHGYSMKLAGLESGINDKAEERAIVMHAADYVSESFIRTKGFLGRSWGCPALPNAYNKPIIDKIKDGSCLFIYGKNSNYLKQSRILNS